MGGRVPSAPSDPQNASPGKENGVTGIKAELDHNDRKSERNGSHLDSLGSGVGVGRAPFPLTPVCFIGCDNVVVLGRACVHMHFLVCYGNMGFLFFYLCSLWSFGSWLSELRTLNSPTRSHCPHNHLLSRGIR